MDPKVLSQVHVLFLREGRSLLHYVSEAYPWTALKDHYLVDLINKLALQEQEGLARIAHWLIRHHVMPTSASSYPMSFTTINFTSLEHLLPYLIAGEKKSILAVQQTIENLKQDDLRNLWQDYLHLKERHLQQLTHPSSPDPSISSDSHAHHT